MYFDWRLFALTAGLRGRIVLAALIGLAALPLNLGRLALSGVVLAAIIRGTPISEMLPQILAIAALKLVDRGALSASSVGAMHGEIGHTQFLPNNVLMYGVGNLNLRDKATALMSTANFLKAHGWRGTSYAANMGAIAGWNSASVYQQAIARMGEAIDR